MSSLVDRWIGLEQSELRRRVSDQSQSIEDTDDSGESADYDSEFDSYDDSAEEDLDSWEMAKMLVPVMIPLLARAFGRFG
jgi:hypothetical protein